MPDRTTLTDGTSPSPEGAQRQPPSAVLRMAESLRDQGKFTAACKLVVDLAGGRRLASDEFRHVLAFLEGSDRQDLAFDASEARIADGAPGAEDFGNAARLAVQVGRFELARERYLQGMAAGLDPYRWKIAEGLATCQRYARDDHPDLALFTRMLEPPGLAPDARAGVLYALGKANDDLARYREAADCWREANGLIAARTHWSVQAWQQAVALAAGPWAPVRESSPGWVPVFVVGMPRSGTTLVARLLAACPEVRNRGELLWIPQLFERIVQANAGQDPAALRDIANWYRRMMVRDDAPARWYIDKQTFNFLHLGLIAALFPQAQVVYCVRSARDVALSTWSQRFHGSAAAFMHRFEDIATVTNSCRQRMAYWKEHLRLPIHTVVYEQLVTEPEATMAGLYRELGMPGPDPRAPTRAAGERDDTVTTASMWQVRQPITPKSVGRWRHYAAHLPELLALFDARESP